jgi:hypothetical protein
MTAIEVIRGTELERKVWSFDYDLTHRGEFSLRLVGYFEQMRATKRHKFTGNKWVYSDERHYCSQLSRPTEIPSDILAEAISEMQNRAKSATVYIGFLNNECIYIPKGET